MPTVGHILRELDRRRFVNGMSALADLATRHADLVTRALARAPRNAKVDLAIFVSTLEKEAAERAAAEAAARPPAEPWRYAAVALMDQRQLAEFKRLVEGGTEPDAAARQVMQDAIMARLGAPAVEPDAEPDEDLDDNAHARRRRGVRRYIPRRLRTQSVEDESEALPARVAAPKPRTRVSNSLSRSGGRHYGPRAFDEFGPLTPEPVEHFPPPWLLPPESDEERDAA